jgi:hypothetical protein
MNGLSRELDRGMRRSSRSCEFGDASPNSDPFSRRGAETQRHTGELQSARQIIGLIPTAVPAQRRRDAEGSGLQEHCSGEAADLRIPSPTKTTPMPGSGSSLRLRVSARVRPFPFKRSTETSNPFSRRGAETLRGATPPCSTQKRCVAQGYTQTVLAFLCASASPREAAHVVPRNAEPFLPQRRRDAEGSFTTVRTESLHVQGNKPSGSCPSHTSCPSLRLRVSARVSSCPFKDCQPPLSHRGSERLIPPGR